MTAQTVTDLFNILPKREQEVFLKMNGFKKVIEEPKRKIGRKSKEEELKEALNSPLNRKVDRFLSKIK
ncbi:hypothetical protein ETU08_00230 [Apibacter muscae]|uniref:hypothetical protein n=1 Tax=Apibacter muscae TaxID=2509004 RepID=UPI0011AC40CC|nr:hypothetical protein [Apibacter muscae]TWP31920.1 hypothetical protein ETU08_00230 [Apibacter muscae]